jgi:hypothetical protein
MAIADAIVIMSLYITCWVAWLIVVLRIRGAECAKVKQTPTVADQAQDQCEEEDEDDIPMLVDAPTPDPEEEEEEEEEETEAKEEEEEDDNDEVVDDSDAGEPAGPPCQVKSECACKWVNCISNLIVHMHKLECELKTHTHTAPAPAPTPVPVFVEPDL